MRMMVRRRCFAGADTLHSRLIDRASSPIRAIRSSTRRGARDDEMTVPRSRGHGAATKSTSGCTLCGTRSRRRDFPQSHHADRPLSISLSFSGRTDRAHSEHSRKHPRRKRGEKTSETLGEANVEARDPTQRGGLDRAERRDERVCPCRGPPPLGGPGPGPYAARGSVSMATLDLRCFPFGDTGRHKYLSIFLDTQ